MLTEPGRVARRSTPARSSITVDQWTARPRTGCSCSRTRPTTIPPRSNPSAARPPAWAAPSAIPLSGPQLCLSGHARHRRGGSHGSPRDRHHAGQAAPAQDRHHGGGRLLLLRQPDRSGHRPCVHEVYHPGYVAKRMEIGAVVGAAPGGNVRRETPAPGDVVVLLGGRTGRDGCGGATGSSKSHTDATRSTTCGAEVQKGNAARGAQAPAAVPQRGGHPADQALQRLRRGRRVAWPSASWPTAWRST